MHIMISQVRNIVLDAKAKSIALNDRRGISSLYGIPVSFKTGRQLESRLNTPSS